jgi:hypothetical protein
MRVDTEHQEVDAQRAAWKFDQKMLTPAARPPGALANLDDNPRTGLDRCRNFPLLCVIIESEQLPERDSNGTSTLPSLLLAASIRQDAKPFVKVSHQ